jgi:molybdate transport system substrate-binding protein
VTSLGEPITGISSMATRAVLATLARAYEVRTERWVTIESVGGVDAAKRVRAGEPFDLVILARDAIHRLMADRHLVRGTARALARSGVAVAVRAGTSRPDIGTEEALRRAVQAARAVGISTGPSGVLLATLFERWGLQLGDRVIVASPGLPVGALLARGTVDIAFQQRSELIHIDGIEVLGPLPASIQTVTTFVGAVGARARQPDAAREVLGFFASRAAADAKRREGMEPPEVPEAPGGEPS